MTVESLGRLPRLTVALSLRSLDTTLLDSVLDRHRSITISTLARPPIVDRLLGRPPLGVLGTAAPGRLGTAVRLLHHLQGTADATEPPVATDSEPMPEYTTPVRSLLANHPTGSAAPLAVDVLRAAGSEPGSPATVDTATKSPASTEEADTTNGPDSRARTEDLTLAARSHSISTSLRAEPSVRHHNPTPADGLRVQQRATARLDPVRRTSESTASATAEPRPPHSRHSLEGVLATDQSVAATESAAGLEGRQSSPEVTTQPPSTVRPSLAHFARGFAPSHRLRVPLQSPTASASVPPTPSPDQQADEPASIAAVPQPHRMGDTGATLSDLATARLPPSAVTAFSQQAPQPVVGPRVQSEASGTSTTQSISQQATRASSPSSPVTHSDTPATPTATPADRAPSTESDGSASSPTDDAEQTPLSAESQSAQRHHVESRPASVEEPVPTPSTVESTARPASRTAVRSHPIQEPQIGGRRPYVSPVFAANRLAAHDVDRPPVWDYNAPVHSHSSRQQRSFGAAPTTPSADTHVSETSSTESADSNASVISPTESADFSALVTSSTATTAAVGPTGPAVESSSTGSPQPQGVTNHPPSVPASLAMPPTPRGSSVPTVDTGSSGSRTDIPPVHRQPSPAPPELPQPEPITLLPTVRSALATAGTRQSTSRNLLAEVPAVVSTPQSSPSVPGAELVALSPPESVSNPTASQPAVRETASTFGSEQTATRELVVEAPKPATPASAQASTPLGHPASGRSSYQPSADTHTTSGSSVQPSSPFRPSDQSTPSATAAVRSVAAALQSAQSVQSTPMPAVSIQPAQSTPGPRASTQSPPAMTGPPIASLGSSAVPSQLPEVAIQDATINRQGTPTVAAALPLAEQPAPPQPSGTRHPSPVDEAAEPTTALSPPATNTGSAAANAERSPPADSTPPSTPAVDLAGQPATLSHEPPRSRRISAPGEMAGPPRPSVGGRPRTRDSDPTYSAFDRLVTQVSRSRRPASRVVTPSLRAIQIPPTGLVAATDRASPVAGLLPRVPTQSAPAPLATPSVPAPDSPTTPSPSVAVPDSDFQPGRRHPSPVDQPDDDQPAPPTALTATPVTELDGPRSPISLATVSAVPAQSPPQPPAVPAQSSQQPPAAAVESVSGSATVPTATTQPTDSGNASVSLSGPTLGRSLSGSSLAPLGSTAARKPLGSSGSATQTLWSRLVTRPTPDGTPFRTAPDHSTPGVATPEMAATRPTAAPNRQTAPTARTAASASTTDPTATPESPPDPTAASESPLGPTASSESTPDPTTVSASNADPLSGVPSLVHQQSLGTGDGDTDSPLPGVEDGPSIARLASAFTTDSAQSTTDTSRIVTDRQTSAQSGPSGFRWRAASGQSLSHPRSRYEPPQSTPQAQEDLEHPRAGRNPLAAHDTQDGASTPKSPFSSPPRSGQPQSTSRPSAEDGNHGSPTDQSTLAETLQSEARTDELVGQLYRKMERKRRIERKRRGL